MALTANGEGGLEVLEVSEKLVNVKLALVFLIGEARVQHRLVVFLQVDSVSVEDAEKRVR